MGSRLIAVLAAAVGVGMAATVTGGHPASASTADQAAARAGHPDPPGGPARFGLGHPAPHPGPPKGLIGPQCSSLPRSGPGSRARLAKVPVGTAVEQTPLLSGLAHAIQVAGLTSTLNAAPAVTLFAADNPGFRVLGQGNLRALLTTKPGLARMITFQAVAGHVTPAELGRGRVLTTLGGTRIHPSKAGTTYYVNNAWVTCGNLRTANGTLYIVTNLIIPNS